MTGAVNPSSSRRRQQREGADAGLERHWFFWEGSGGVALDERNEDKGRGCGVVVHPGERWAICRDSKGSLFGLAPAE